MQIIHEGNHPIRKALSLSLIEMAVLCDIIQMSQDPKFSYWCIKSKEKIAEWLDVSRDTVFRSMNALEAKGFIERSKIGVRPTDIIREIQLAQDEIGVYLKRGDFVLVSAKIAEMLPSDSPSENQTTLSDTQSENQTVIVAKSDGDSSKIRLSPSENQTQVLHRVLHENYIKDDSVKNPESERLFPPNAESNTPPISPGPPSRKLKVTRKAMEFIAPTIDEVKEYFRTSGYSEQAGIKFFQYYENGNPPWSDAKGNPVRSWKQKAQSVWFKDENKVIQSAAPAQRMERGAGYSPRG